MRVATLLKFAFDDAPEVICSDRYGFPGIGCNRALCLICIGILFSARRSSTFDSAGVPGDAFLEVPIARLACLLLPRFFKFRLWKKRRRLQQRWRHVIRSDYGLGANQF